MVERDPLTDILTDVTAHHGSSAAEVVARTGWPGPVVDHALARLLLARRLVITNLTDPTPEPTRYARRRGRGEDRHA